MIDLSAGQLVADKYRVDHVIGAGGMGVVLAATHLDLDQPVAIKVLRDANAEAIARFQREARLIVRLKSEHVARVFDVGALDDDTPYYVMERLEGEDLSKLLAKRGQLPVEQAVDYVLEACEAVAEAHTLGVVHRDLKPANLFVARGPGGRGSVKVLDFGVSKTVTEGSQVGHLTNEGVALGSPGYMAPEQIESSRDVDARADIYSLGAILYRLTSGVNPYKGETVMSVLAAMASAPLVPLRSVVEVPADFARIVELCLSQEPESRPSSIADLAKALAPFGSRRAQASLEQILATMGVDDVGLETVTIPSPQKTERLPGREPEDDSEAITTTPRNGRDLALQATVVAMPRPPTTPRMVSVAPPARRRAPASSNASLLPLGLAMVFLVAIVGWVVFRRSTPPPPGPAPSADPEPTVVVAPPPPTTVMIVPAPAPEPAPDPSGARPKTKPHPRPTPAPAPATPPKKPVDAPPNLSDIGGRH
ncbi:MAG: serine/threonine-protein kinase [Labilithrix sp.]